MPQAFRNQSQAPVILSNQNFKRQRTHSERTSSQPPVSLSYQNLETLAGVPSLHHQYSFGPFSFMASPVLKQKSLLLLKMIFKHFCEQVLECLSKEKKGTVFPLDSQQGGCHLEKFPVLQVCMNFEALRAVFWISMAQCGLLPFQILMSS